MSVIGVKIAEFSSRTIRKNGRVCELHFQRSDYFVTDNVCHLKKNSVPVGENCRWLLRSLINVNIVNWIKWRVLRTISIPSVQSNHNILFVITVLPLQGKSTKEIEHLLHVIYIMKKVKLVHQNRIIHVLRKMKCVHLSVVHVYRLPYRTASGYNTARVICTPARRARTHHWLPMFVSPNYSYCVLSSFFLRIWAGQGVCMSKIH